MNTLIDARKLVKESPDDKYGRVATMKNRYDLSPNDIAALKHILGMVNLMADEIAEQRGIPIPGVFRIFGDKVAEIQT